MAHAAAELQESPSKQQQFVTGFPVPPFFYLEYGPPTAPQKLPAAVLSCLQQQQQAQQQRHAVGCYTDGTFRSQGSAAAAGAAGPSSAPGAAGGCRRPAAGGGEGSEAGEGKARSTAAVATAAGGTEEGRNGAAAEAGEEGEGRLEHHRAAAAAELRKKLLLSTWVWGGRPPPPLPTSGYWSSFGVAYAEEYREPELDTDTKMYREPGERDTAEEEGELQVRAAEEIQTKNRPHFNQPSESFTALAAGGAASPAVPAAAGSARPGVTLPSAASSHASDSSSSSSAAVGIPTPPLPPPPLGSIVDLKDEFRRLYKVYVQQTLELLDTLAQGGVSEGGGGSLANRWRRITRLHKNLLHILLRLQQYQAEQDVLQRLEKQLLQRHQAADELKRTMALIKVLLEQQAATAVVADSPAAGAPAAAAAPADTAGAPARSARPLAADTSATAAHAAAAATPGGHETGEGERGGRGRGRAAGAAQVAKERTGTAAPQPAFTCAAQGTAVAAAPTRRAADLTTAAAAGTDEEAAAAGADEEAAADAVMTEAH